MKENKLGITAITLLICIGLILICASITILLALKTLGNSERLNDSDLIVENSEYLEKI